MKIALISASWHQDLIGGAKAACIEELGSKGVEAASQIDDFAVPGSLEIPLFAQKLAQTGKYSAIIAFGLIVDGGIYRHEFVASAVINGLVRVQLDTGVPVFSCVLTPHSFHDHDTHLSFFRDHLKGKGTEVARSCMGFLEVLASVENK